jgi:probable F420-dependent oxidoreductase
MKIGITLPHIGKDLSPASITTIAQEAERQDFASLWVGERLLYPRYFVPYGNNTQGIPTPDFQRVSYEPLETLTYAAAKTERIKLGTNVIDVFFQAPTVLARRFTTLDHFSNGRVIAGIGRGWMKEEFDAAGIPFERANSDFGDYVRALRALWGPNPVRYQGSRYVIAESDVDPKPIQPGGPPLLIGTASPKTIKLAAKFADGLTPVFYSWDMASRVVHDFYEQVRLNGRDPSRMEIIVRANNDGILPQPLPESRMPFMGSYEQICDDIQRLKALGIEHILFDLSPANLPIAEQLRQMERLRRAADV